MDSSGDFVYDRQTTQLRARVKAMNFAPGTGNASLTYPIYF
jgi:hypothetical protein